MKSVLLLALAGFFIGGTYSLWRNNNRVLAVILGLLAALTFATALLWTGA